MTKQTEKDALFTTLSEHLGRIGYTASRLNSWPDGFKAITLEEMGRDVLHEITTIWKLIGYSERDWDDQLARACVDVLIGRRRKWKPYE